MEITSIEISRAVVVRPEEDLRLVTVEDVVKTIEEVLKRDIGSVIIDFSVVDHIDSSGVGCLIRILRMVQSAGKRLLITALRPQVRRVFRFSNLYKVFEVYQKKTDAFFALKGCKVLVWDERKEVQDFYGEILRANGFIPVGLGSREEAEKALDLERPALVLLDVQKDETDKLEFVRGLCGEGTPRIPVAVVSGLPEEESIYREIGAALFVSKPFRLENLIADLRQVVESEE
jgi:anti-anti-sigma factor